MNIQNPVIRGFYPDPSVCEADGTYYLACSSFQYFPGVPLFESRDLVNWKPAGHCLTRESQAALHQVPASGGIFAPTLRYHGGRFYMVTNHNTLSRNFYVYTDDIYGEWSEPVFVDQDGIDPSLFFEGKKVYFTSNGTGEDGQPCILQCEIDIQTGEKLTQTVCIWKGSGGRYLEAPHLYHIGEWYYLFAAEGGTEYGHMVTYARAKDPYGPYESYKGNPVLTNRNLGGNQSVIQGIGHGDLCIGPDGEYYLLCLGFRQTGEWKPFHHLGREVFLAQVFWQPDGWFRAGEEGTVREWTECKNFHAPQRTQVYDLDLNLSVFENPRWIFLRECHRENFRFQENRLFVRGTRVTLNEADAPSFAGVRQSEFYTHLWVTAGGSAKEAGVTFYMDECHHYDLFCRMGQSTKEAVLRLHIGDAQQELSQLNLEMEEEPVLEVISDPEQYTFYIVCKRGRHCLGNAGTKYLSSEAAGGFTGTVMGLYAVDADMAWAEFSNLLWTQRTVLA